MYRHTQAGTVILWWMLGGALLVLSVVLFLPDEPGAGLGRVIGGVALLILIGTAWLFRSLTITVGEGILAWHFGPGLLRWRVPLSEVAAAEPVRTGLLAGWGIHWTPRGWLYNVSGRSAVRVSLHSGRQFLLGSDEPERLIRAIEHARPGASP